MFKSKCNLLHTYASPTVLLLPHAIDVNTINLLCFLFLSHFTQH